MCGWGGEGHEGGGGGGNVWSWHIATRTEYPSFVNPNAPCPVCGVQVFFYQSPEGGRVFFDDLGPPWPKHPCTDSVRNGYRDNVILLADINLDAQLMAIGQQQGWRPFVSSFIRPLPGRQLRIHGRFYRRDGRPGLETFLDTLDADGDRGRDIEHFHRYGSGLPFFVREHAANGYFQIAEIDLLAKHGAPEKMRARETNPVMCVPPENGIRIIRRELRQ